MKESAVLEYYYNFTNYKVVITYKRMRNMVYRYDAPSLTFKVSAPFYTSNKKVLKYLEKFAPKLILKSKIKQPAIKGDIVYIFGRQYVVTIGKYNRFNNDGLMIKSKDQLNKVLKKILLEYLEEKVPMYEKLMNIKPYKIGVRNMHTRHASNSKYKHHLSFSTSLVHYFYPIIDSVIVHELAHDTHFDHSKSFYDLVYKYCPNYKMYKKALDNTRYDYGIN